MRNDTKILAVIPARSGSKGIPNKNIRLFAGKPLIVHSIEAAKDSPSIDRVIVSTDSDEIAAVAKKAGAEAPFLRPAELATAESKVSDAVIDLLERLKKEEAYNPSHILLLQPTSPLRTHHDIEAAIKLFFATGADSLVSVCKTENLLLTKDPANILTIRNTEDLASPNRQELPQCYKLDGSMLYMVKTERFLKEQSFFSGKLVGFEIERWRAIDLDEPQDFILGELIFQNRDAIAKKIQSFS
jgi:CMP-N,N'-diacetyllegionaminic acid synthase